jgi:hypothetical protein
MGRTSTWYLITILAERSHVATSFGRQISLSKHINRRTAQGNSDSSPVLELRSAYLPKLKTTPA